jgi:drug/metabolite transporter (DMT)-like permease
MRERAGAVVLLAAVQVAIPFMLITFGEEEISSSLAGILVSSAPIFTAILAVWIDHSERSRGWNLVGVVVGIVGVALLLGLDVGGDAGALLGAGMILAASFGYAVGGFMLKRKFSDLQPIGTVTATMLVSAAMLLPWALFTFPESFPDLEATASILALGVLGTGVAFVIFYTLIATEGPAKASVVAYIAPIFAVFYGATLLDEPVSLSTFLGMALILLGSWLAAEGRIKRAEPVPAMPDTGGCPDEKPARADSRAAA